MAVAAGVVAVGMLLVDCIEEPDRIEVVGRIGTCEIERLRVRYNMVVDEECSRSSQMRLLRSTKQVDRMPQVQVLVLL